MADDQGLIAEWVGFEGHDGDSVGGYLARPTGEGTVGGVIVLHEVFGLVPHIKELALKFALNGYVTIAPDLHYREGPGDPDDVAAAVRAAGGNPDARTIGDVEGAARLLRSLPGSNGKVGIMGFCSGGRQAYLSACNIPSLDAAVDCYGGRVVAPVDSLNERQPQAPVEMTAGLGCPLLGLVGAQDANPSPEQTREIEGELKKHGKIYEFHTYEGAGHGFFADYRTSYNQEAASDGWQRVYDWFGRYLS